MKKISLAIALLGIIMLSGCGAKKPPVSFPTPITKGLLMSVVAEHNTLDDCWLVVNNNVYNISDFIGAHPGGEKNISNYCGKDATIAFETRPTGSKTPHSDRAREILAKYYIGDLAK